jgi:hypothetical protein
VQKLSSVKYNEAKILFNIMFQKDRREVVCLILECIFLANVDNRNSSS